MNRFGIKKSKVHIFLVLEFCAGGDLSKFIKRRGRLPEVFPVGRALEAHALVAGWAE